MCAAGTGKRSAPCCTETFGIQRTTRSLLEKTADCPKETPLERKQRRKQAYFELRFRPERPYKQKVHPSGLSFRESRKIWNIPRRFRVHHFSSKRRIFQLTKREEFAARPFLIHASHLPQNTLDHVILSECAQNLGYCPICG